MATVEEPARRISGWRVTAFAVATLVWIGLVGTAALIAALGECGIEPREPCSAGGSMGAVAVVGVLIWCGVGALVFRRRLPRRG